MSVHLPKFGRFIAELLKHGGLTLATDADGNRHDPTKEPHSYLHEVEVREVLLRASNIIFAPPAVLSISGLTPQAAHGLAPLAVPSKKSLPNACTFCWTKAT